MGAFAEKRWVRVLALTLFFLFSVGAFLSLHIYSFAFQDGWYGREDYTFAESHMARLYTSDALGFVARNLVWLDEPNSTKLGGYGGDAFAYTIEDYYTGEKYADTTTENSHFVLEYSHEVTAGDGVYRLRGYVNLPVQPYDGCYREYYVFTHLFGLRSYYLPVGILLALLTVAALGICILGTVRIGRKGTVTLLGRLPFDGMVLVLPTLEVLVESFFYDRLTVVRQVIGVLDMLRVYQGKMHRVFMLWVGGVLLLALIDQLCAHVFYEKLIVRRALKKLPQGTALAVTACLQLFPLLMLISFFYGDLWPIDIFGKFFDFDPLRILLWLLVLDVVVLLCAIRWTREQKRVRQATDALARGELNYKLDEKRLHFVWRDMGQDLNSIGDGMAVAVEERLRSERMKTELITNVSHDLKTPLTSIINYISLLREKDLPAETQKEYLEVLDRQSAKLKKLTEDVVEASKAASGVMPVHAETLDVTELLEQSVGEYAARMQESSITPVIHTPEQRVHIFADGRLLGRVLDNFITNIVKYAQPGTRAYFDLAVIGTDAVITVKNTSCEPLDIPAEELMERFVRGDSSRSTEGSGLGLSIARSLTELMGGQMQLILDGDLFKTQVTFPVAVAPELPAPETEETASPE